MVSTIIPLPTSVSNSIISAAAMMVSATTRVSVIINQVYALGLPCADEPTSGLSTGAKAGIGVGAGVGGLLLLSLSLLICGCVKRTRLGSGQENTSYYQPPEKKMSPSTGAMATPVSMGVSYIKPTSPQFLPHNLSYSLPTNQAYDTNQLPAVGTETPQRREIYEIGNGEREASLR
jgi:hypothetical protein